MSLSIASVLAYDQYAFLSRRAGAEFKADRAATKIVSKRRSTRALEIDELGAVLVLNVPFLSRNLRNGALSCSSSPSVRILLTFLSHTNWRRANALMMTC